MILYFCLIFVITKQNLFISLKKFTKNKITILFNKSAGNIEKKKGFINMFILIEKLIKFFNVYSELIYLDIIIKKNLNTSSLILNNFIKKISKNKKIFILSISDNLKNPFNGCRSLKKIK